MNDKIIGILIIVACLVIGMWILEIGPFKKHYPSTNTYGGYEPSFGGRNGPCGYNYHNCTYKCNDWRVPSGGGPECGNCGHDMMFHSPSNPRY